MTQMLIDLFKRDLEKLIEELSLYEDENLIWKVAPGIKNSAGNLALHLIGNLNYFIGAVLGNTNYVRNRKAEFEDKDIPQVKIKKDIEQTIGVISQTLKDLNEKNLAENYPLEVFKKPMKTDYFLLHLYGHLNYHLGQVNYHRRLLS